MNELSTFVVKFSLIQMMICNDDLVNVFIFIYLKVDQQYFKELTDNDIRERMYKEQQDQLEQDMVPFGFVDNGLNDPNEQAEVDEFGWSEPVVKIRDHNTDW